MSFSSDTRAKNIEEMQSEVFDLLIIGGGITGAGVARDAASRGMKVALIEADDFGSGTSSRSSKLIHGGIRYLENLEFGLVFEALRERRNLFEIAPHLVHPLRFQLPLYKGGRVGMFKLGLGMWLYDALSLFEVPMLHERLSKKEALERAPMLREEGLLGAYVYSDAYMDDDRMVIETLRSANHNGAVAANYVKATGGIVEEGRLSSVKVKDLVGEKEFAIRARHFVSTVGPWTDLVGSAVLGEWKKLLRPSKGIHITLRRDRLPLDEAVVMISDDEKRIVFGIPRHEMIIIGTTDTDFPEDPSEVTSTRDDIEYLLHIANSYFPNADITEDDIIASYSGVRPLVDDGADEESKTSREHLIFSDPRNITFVTGGKYTTYRSMAEETVEVALEHFPLEDRVRFSKPNTLEPLNPLVSPEKLHRAQIEAHKTARLKGLSECLVRKLVDRHGKEAEVILDRYLPNQLNGGLRLSQSSEEALMWELEAKHAIRETMCLKLIDFYLRRAPLFLSRQDHGLMLADHLSRVFKNELGWSDAQRTREVSLIREHLETEMGWRSPKEYIVAEKNRPGASEGDRRPTT